MYKVGIVGPESTGKSMLAAELACRLDGIYIEEYARTYVANLERSYTYDDVCAIAQHQVEEMSQDYGNKTVLFDTELIITKVWFEAVYKRCPTFVGQAQAACPMDYYLICYPDIEAEPDPLRENLDKREYYYDWYVREVQATGIPYTIIRGTGEERIQRALEALLHEQEKK